MKWSISAFSLVACLSLTAAGSVAQTLDTPSTQASFYKISDGATTIYLLGSIHIGPQNLYPLPKEMEDAFTAATTLVVEENDDNESGSDNSGFLAAVGKVDGAIYPDGDTIWNHLDKPTTDKLKYALDTWSRDKDNAPPQGLLDGIGQCKPWLVGFLLEYGKSRAAGFRPDLGIDTHFVNEAKGSSGPGSAAAKPITPIETASSQMKLISELVTAPDKQQVAALKTVLEDYDKPDSADKAMFENWLSNNEAAVAKHLLADPVSPDPKVNDEITKDRNLVMADFIEKDLKSKTQAFVVVGAGHLVGDAGIVALLRRRGYSVKMEPVTWTHKILSDSKPDPSNSKS